jgi:hypothetical protein
MVKKNKGGSGIGRVGWTLGFCNKGGIGRVGGWVGGGIGS